MDFSHVTVLLKETVDGLKIKPNGIYVDGTLGGGGHSEAICKELNCDGLLVGIDQDEEALKAAGERLAVYANKTQFVHSNFSNVKKALKSINVETIDGMIMDLGVSSYQLDEADRGFSYMNTGKLDMRMDQNQTLSAYEVINEYSFEALNRIITDYGEERWAKRVVEFIVEARNEKPIETTEELVTIIKKAIPAAARKDGPHPAKRTFQAIRIEVNNELGILKETVKNICDVLKPGGRIAIITFHSLEDRIIKNVFRELSLKCICPPEMPICTCNTKPLLKVITRKPILPLDTEIEANPRARSAKLRIAEKI